MAETKTAELHAEVLHRATGPDAAVREIAELAAAQGDWHSIDMDGPQYVLVPEGAEIEGLNGALLRPLYEHVPQRMFGVARPGTVEAFVHYVQHFDNPGLTVWVPVKEGKIIAVFNDHAIVTSEDQATDKAGWGDHRAELTLTKTPEWEHWAGETNGVLMGQDAFANHIEDGMEEIVAPPAADLLEMAQSIHATNNAKFKSQRLLENGEVKFEYTEDIDATAGKNGDMTIPAEFDLAIAPFVGEEKYKVKARLRYRLQNGNLQIGYKLIRPDAVLRDAYQRIADGFMGIERDDAGEIKGDGAPLFRRVYFGQPSENRGLDEEGELYA